MCCISMGRHSSTFPTQTASYTNMADYTDNTVALIELPPRRNGGESLSSPPGYEDRKQRGAILTPPISHT